MFAETKPATVCCMFETTDAAAVSGAGAVVRAVTVHCYWPSLHDQDHISECCACYYGLRINPACPVVC
jgi:hypothetical protein